MEQYINTSLLIMIPWTMWLGTVLKRLWLSQKDTKLIKLYKRIMGSTNGIKIALYIINIVHATIFGFVYSTNTGWRLIADAVVVFGICHGVVISFIATRMYDKVRKA